MLASKQIIIYTFNMDIKEFARLGGQARARLLSASKRKEIAIKACHAMHSKYKHACKQANQPSDIEWREKPEDANPGYWCYEHGCFRSYCTKYHEAI